MSPLMINYLDIYSYMFQLHFTQNDCKEHIFPVAGWRSFTFRSALLFRDTVWNIPFKICSILALYAVDVLLQIHDVNLPFKTLQVVSVYLIGSWS